MATFAVLYRYTDDSAGRDAVRPTHRAYLSELVEDGFLRVSGPWSGGSPGALLIYVADSAEQVSALTAADPFVREGLVEEYEVRAWDAVLGPLSDDLSR
jgi:uncharacterized protein YciI